MKPSPKALVVDDEPSVLGFVSEVLDTGGWEVHQADSAEKAYSLAETTDIDLVFCDVMLGSTDGYAVLRRFAQERPEAKFVLMTGHGSAAGALDATAIGAFDYLVKPFSVSDVMHIADVVRGQLARRTDSHAESSLDVSSAPGYTSDIPLIGKSPAFVECLKMVGRVAPTSLSVLITGESGTGKEIVANAIHRRSTRASGPFVTVNCGAIPTELIESELFGHVKGSFTGAATDRLGLWEEAAGGTLFLDEITETPPQFQVKLLRALQESEIRRVGSNKMVRVDARVIGATNRDIEEEVEKGRFRQDLMYRLNAVTIRLPPLRERHADIPLLATHFASRVAAAKVPFAPEALRILKSYEWPGNVRELENAVLHAVSMADDMIYPEHLPERVRSGSPLTDREGGPKTMAEPSDDPESLFTLAEMELRYVTKVLDHTGGNKQAASRILNIDRKTLTRILSRAGGA